jgi:hypothetical protein
LTQINNNQNTKCTSVQKGQGIPRRIKLREHVEDL